MDVTYSPQLYNSYIYIYIYIYIYFTSLIYILINLYFAYICIRLITVEGKAAPLQAWSSPEVSRKLRFPDFVTTAKDGGKVVSLMHRPPLPPGNAPGTHYS